MRARRLIPVLIAIACAPLNADALTLIYQENHTGIDNGPFRLISSSPYDRQALDLPPQRISVSFSQPLYPARSSIRVFDSFGHQVEAGELEAEGMELSVPVPELNPGRYRVKWRARCQCGGDSELSDSFYFTVR